MINKIKNETLKYVRHKPRLRKLLSKTYLFFLKIRITKTKFKKIYYVNPNDIINCSRYFNIYNSEGKIKSGDWDLKKQKNSDFPTFKGLNERFIDKKNWEDTIYYKKNLKEIESGKVLWNCTNKKEFEIRCKEIDKLYEEIKKNGFKLQNKVSKNKDIRNYDYVTINIGRDGELLFNDGAHRLAIAQILNLDKIPVKIIVRHKKWYKYIKKIDKLLPNKVSYQSLNHPDLDTNFKIVHNCKDREELIKEFIKKEKIKKGKLLDIGANMGYFSQKLEEIDYIPYLIEHESNFIEYLKETKKVRKYHYKIIQKDMFEWEAIKKKKFEITLALNIFHHYLKTEDFYLKLVKFLNKLNTNVMFLETHNPKETQMKGIYKNYTPKEFVEFIKKETGLNKSKKIADISDGRELYLLKK